MKKYWLVVLLFISVYAEAQNRTNVWELGDNPSMGTNYPAYGINFNEGFADTFSVFRRMRFFITDASICDSDGQLLFYTNGIYVANHNNDSLYNTSDFNEGYSTEFYAEDGLGFSQGALVIPKPGDPAKYYIFSITADQLNYRGYSGTFPTHLSCSEVDMGLDNGLGGIDQNFKNVHVVEDTIYKGRITGCKHANGRDWWVVVKEMWTNKYYTLLVTPDGINSPLQQAIGESNSGGNIFGMATFSPDGSKYAYLNINDTIDLLQFDRCTGEFSNPVTLLIPDTGSLSATVGCSFSPNSRFLYVTSYKRLWQFDTWANDINGAKIFIDSIDVSTSINWFFLHQLASDGKIYISTWNTDGSAPILHVIDQPDSIGIACHFMKDALKLPPTTGNTCVPNFPNYDLGALTGSDCDTLTAIHQIISISSTIRLAPNPSTNWLNIIYNSSDDALFELYDLFGQRVATMSLFHYFKNRLLDVSGLSAGSYFAVVKQDGIKVWSEEVIVAK